MKHTLLLEDLNCAHCAAKIETKIAETEGYDKVSFNFATKKLSFESEKESPAAEIQAICDSIEDGVTVKPFAERSREHHEHHEHCHDGHCGHDHEHSHEHGEKSKLKNILLIDEAHVLLAGRSAAEEGSADSQGSTIEALEDMIAEIRSYGTGIIIADQSPTAVGRNIVANTNVKMIFKLVEKENKDAIATATNMEEAEYDRLGRLGVGEAMLHYGRVYAPLHIKTYNIQERASIRPVIGDEEVHAHVRYWDTHGELLIPHRECAFCGTCAHSCDMKVRSDADFLAARLISKYLYDLPDKKAFVQFLVQLDPKIRAEAEVVPNLRLTLRLVNCTKIKFLRKALLAKNYGISQAEYDVILKHPRFLKRAEAAAGKGGA